MRITGGNWVFVSVHWPSRQAQPYLQFRFLLRYPQFRFLMTLFTAGYALLVSNSNMLYALSNLTRLEPVSLWLTSSRLRHGPKCHPCHYPSRCVLKWNCCNDYLTLSCLVKNELGNPHSSLLLCCILHYTGSSSVNWLAINVYIVCKKLPHKTLHVHSARYTQCMHVSTCKLKLPRDIHTSKVQTPLPTHPFPESAATHSS